MSSSLPSDLSDFLRAYPRMSLRPKVANVLVIEGMFDFSASCQGFPEIQDAYRIRISVEAEFSRHLPEVEEIGSKIPRDGHHHVNPNGTLCLGSPLRLRTVLAGNPTLLGFSDACLVPYLYGVSYKKQQGRFPFDELAHGADGVMSDYMDLFRLPSVKQVAMALKLLAMKRRVSNKRPCPCGCGKRYGRCNYRHSLDSFRKFGSRKWFRKHSKDPGGGT